MKPCVTFNLQKVTWTRGYRDVGFVTCQLRVFLSNYATYLSLWWRNNLHGMERPTTHKLFSRFNASWTCSAVQGFLSKRRSSLCLLMWRNMKYCWFLPASIRFLASLRFHLFRSLLCHRHFCRKVKENVLQPKPPRSADSISDVFISLFPLFSFLFHLIQRQRNRNKIFWETCAFAK